MAVIAVSDGSAGFAANAAGYVAATAGGDTVAGGFRASGWHLPVVLLVRNTDATNARTVTVGSMPGVSVPAVTGVAVIPVLGSPVGAAVPVTYSSATGLTVAAARLTNPLE